jgi:proteasome accessory factor C
MEAYIDEDEVIIDAAEYFARAPRLTPTEAISLLAAGMAISGSGQGSPELDSAVRKLTKVVVPDADKALMVDVSGESEMVGRLRQAASNGKLIHIVYRSLSKETETSRVVEPWAVFTTMGNWYVQGHCRLVDAERTFRVDRIRDLEVSEDTFNRPEALPAPGVGYVPSDEDIVCDISLSDRARWVLDYYPVEVLRETKNRLHIRFHSPDAEIPARLVLRLGGEAKLLRGDEVANRARELGTALLAKHQ